MSFRSLTLLSSVFLLQACFVYDQDLLDEGRAGLDTTGGSSPGSGGSEPASGGSTSGGGGTDTGGTPGDGDGGDATGGTGGDATGGTGGESSGGTGGTGGDATGGSGGETSGPTFTLVDAMDHPGNFKYSNFPFTGEYGRYGQESDGSCNAAVWDTASVGDMFVEDPDDSENNVLRVRATDLDCWGVGVFMALNAPAGIFLPRDLSEYDGIRLRARRLVNESVVNVRLADESSHPEACGESCLDDALRPINLGTSWTVFVLPFDEFTRTGDALDLTMVYALHFALDPAETTVDFLVDDIEFYTD